MAQTDMHKRMRGRNWAVFVALIAFVVVVFVVSMAKFKGGMS